ncbi:TPA: hypothetical protein U2L31_006276 [Burkholderia contaminans]|nr:hypothetical protein [Burkholderia contaminans]
MKNGVAALKSAKVKGCLENWSHPTPNMGEIFQITTNAAATSYMAKQEGASTTAIIPPQSGQIHISK